MVFIIVNIHICMLLTTHQFNVFLYIMHMHVCLRLNCLCIFAKEGQRKIGYQPTGFPSQNKEFTYLLTYLLHVTY